MSEVGLQGIPLDNKTHQNILYLTGGVEMDDNIYKKS